LARRWDKPRAAQKWSCEAIESAGARRARNHAAFLGGSFRTPAELAKGNPFNGRHLIFFGVSGAGGQQQAIEVSFRHFSNLGIVRPNVGQNFRDIAVAF
jgi:hypothetical protein